MPKQTERLPHHYRQFREDLARDIGRRIAEARLERNLTQEAVRAKMELLRVHVSRSQYSRIENGEALPDSAEVVALANVMEVSFDWLLLGKESGE